MNRLNQLPSATLVLLAASLAAASIGGCGAEGSDDTGQSATGPTPDTSGTTPDTMGSTSPIGTMTVGMPMGSTTMPSPNSTIPTTTPLPETTGTNPVAPVPEGNEPVAMPMPDPDSSTPVPDPVMMPSPDVTGPTPDTPEPTPDPAPTGNCTFTVEHSLSDAIATVGIVTFSVAGMTPTEARIDFSLASGGWDLSAPVDLAEPNYRTLLLGMKEDSDYTFQIVASDGTQECTSEQFMLTTDPVPNAVTRPMPQIMNAEAQSKGFIVTTAGIGSLGGGGGGGGQSMFVFDTDGDIVWYADAPNSSGRALLDWEGKNMYVATLNYPQGNGEMRRISMDGTESETIPALGNVHHDFTVTPDGLAVIMYEGDCSGIFRYTPEGGVSPIVARVDSLYQPGGGFMGGGFECHPNAITYQAADDTFVVSDRNPNLFVRFTSSGELLWQFGGSEPMGNHLEGTWSVNHGHHLLEDGTFLFFNNGNGNPSPVLGFQLDTSAWQATQIWDFTLQGSGSATLGDVQRLPNGNTLITYSNGGTIVEVDGQDNIVARFTAGSLGYSHFRESLYGPAPK